MAIKAGSYVPTKGESYTILYCGHSSVHVFVTWFFRLVIAGHWAVGFANVLSWSVLICTSGCMIGVSLHVDAEDCIV